MDTGGTSGKSRGTSDVEPSGGYHDAVLRSSRYAPTGTRLRSLRYAPTSTRVFGMASLASGGYCAPAVLYPSSTAHTEHATASANCLEADAAHGCAQLLGSSSRGCRYREHRGAACPTLPVDVGMEAAIAALASAFSLAALRSRFAEDADRVAHSPSCVGAAASSPVGRAITCNTSASRIAAAWRACRQSRAAHAASRLTVALSDASHAARSAPLAQATGAYAPPHHHTAAAQVLIRSWRATAARRRASAGCALLKVVHRPKLQSAQAHSPDAPTQFLPGPVVIATTSPFRSVWGQRVWEPRYSCSRPYRLASGSWAALHIPEQQTRLSPHASS